MSPDELIAVIERGLKADEEAAESTHRDGCRWIVFTHYYPCDCGTPSRVLADVESKREVIRLYWDTLATIETFEHRGLAAKGYEVAAESYLNVLWALARPYLGQERA